MDSVNVAKVLEKLASFDADLRFMGLSDLSDLMVSSSVSPQLNSRGLAQIKGNVIQMLSDDITEVQTQAVKTLGAMVPNLTEIDAIETVDEVLALPKSEIRDLALRTILSSIRQTPRVVKHVIESILPEMGQDVPDLELSIENLGVFKDLVSRFRNFFNSEQVGGAQERAQKLARSSRTLISRRASEIVLLLTSRFTDFEWRNLAEFISKELNGGSSSSAVKALLLLAGLFEANSAKARLIDGVLTTTVKLALVEDEDTIEVAEAALTALEAQLAAQNSPISKVLATQLVDLAIHDLRFNPNVADFMEDDEQDLDEDMDFSGASDFDDDDLSWKVRRYAAKVVVQLVRLVTETDTRAFLVNSLVQALGAETDKSVKADILAALTSVSDIFPAALDDYTDTLISLTLKEDAVSGYLPLLERVSARYTGDADVYLDQVSKIASKRAQTHESEQLGDIMSFLYKTVSNANVLRVAEDPESPFWQAISPYVFKALSYDQYPIQSAALGVISKSAGDRLLHEVKVLASKGKSVTIRSLSLTVGATIAAKPGTSDDAAEDFVRALLAVLTREVELRLVAIDGISKIASQRKISEEIAGEATRRLGELVNSQARTVTITALRTLIILSAQAPAQKAALGATVLRLPDDPELFEIKCEALSAVASEPGVADAAFNSARNISKNSLRTAGISRLPVNLPPGASLSPLAKLFEAIAREQSAETNSALLASITEEGTSEGAEAAFWAELAATVLVVANLPTQFISHQWSEWSALVSVFLGSRGHITLDPDAILERAQENVVSALIAGYALGTASALTGKVTAVMTLVDPTNADFWLGFLDILSSWPFHDSSTHAPDLRSGLDAFQPYASTFYKPDDAKAIILGRVLARVAASARDFSEFMQPWFGTLVGLEAAKILLSDNPDKAKDALSMLITMTPVLKSKQGIDPEHLRSIEQVSLGALAWGVRSHVDLAHELEDQLLPVIFEASKKRPELVRTIQVGPFKHHIDDGLGSRKAAYDALLTFTLSEGALFQSDNRYLKDVMVQTVQGLQDDHEIKLIACLLLNKLATAATELVASSIVDIRTEFEASAAIKVKENSVKQDHDRKASIMRAISGASKIITIEMLAKNYGDPGLEAFIEAK